MSKKIQNTSPSFGKFMFIIQFEGGIMLCVMRFKIGIDGLCGNVNEGWDELFYIRFKCITTITTCSQNLHLPS